MGHRLSPSLLCSQASVTVIKLGTTAKQGLAKQAEVNITSFKMI